MPSQPRPIFWGPDLSGVCLWLQLTTGDKSFDAAPWLAEQTVKEMVARGLPVQLGNDAKGPDTVIIQRIHIENRRVSGFSPFETFTSASADVVTPAGTTRIATFIKRGKSIRASLAANSLAVRPRGSL
jgi:hypothetical protein